MFVTARCSPGFVPFTLQATTIAAHTPAGGRCHLRDLTIMHRQLTVLCGLAESTPRRDRRDRLHS
jgi:hypothetical protein